jgi:hypothetical protein
MPRRSKKRRGRRHTNIHAHQTIKSERLKRDVRRMARIMRVPYGKHHKERKEENE